MLLSLFGIGLAVVALIVIALIVIALIFYLLSIYNSLITLKNNIDKAWSNIDVMLVQRNNELTKLLDTVKGYMKHEKKTLEEVTRLRAGMAKASGPQEKAQANDLLSSAIGRLFMVAENYPQLRASENFNQLQGRISELENGIADRREFYNDSVNTFNIRIQQIPDSVIAGMMHLEKKEMFKPAPGATEDVKMNFE